MTVELEEVKEVVSHETEVKPVKVVLTKDQEVLIFKSLAHKTLKEAGYDYGVQFMFPNDDRKVVTFVSSIVQKIKKAPELWGLSEDLVEVVQEAMDSRSIKNNPNAVADRNIRKEGFRDKLDDMRDKTADLIFKKLKKFGTPKGLEGAQLRDLKDLLAMAIDKGRLLRGESTENIKKLSPLNVDAMKPEDALAIIMKARDVLIESKK